jgi:hypothetical protein
MPRQLRGNRAEHARPFAIRDQSCRGWLGILATGPRPELSPQMQAKLVALILRDRVAERLRAEAGCLANPRPAPSYGDGRLG